MTPADALAAALARALPAVTTVGGPDIGVGVAVSGGGDSVALMALLAEWARHARRAGELAAARRDGGSRPAAEAAAEAAQVAEQAAALGLAHETLVRDGPPSAGNLQANARELRFALLADWARRNSLGAVCLAHTMEDQAETVLLRLVRGSGVDGLAGMKAARRATGGGPVWLRPLLGVRRAALRDVLRARGTGWIDDPGNADARFARVRARSALADPPLAGLDVPTLAETAARMAAAKTVLAQGAYDAARRLLRVEHGSIGLALDGFSALPDDTRWRLLAAALCRVGGQAYRPRLKALHRAEAAIAARRRFALAGCIVGVQGRCVWIDREPAALSERRAAVPGIWDGRWRIEGPARPGIHLAALGPGGLAQRPGWRAAGLRRTPLLTAPGIWEGDRLVAAPTLPPSPRDASHWRCRPVWDTIRACADLRPD